MRRRRRASKMTRARIATWNALHRAAASGGECYGSEISEKQVMEKKFP